MGNALNNLDYCNHLFDSTTDGYMQVKQIINDTEKITIFNTDNANLRQVVMDLDKSKDTYLSINTHFIPSGTFNTIRQFRALYIDLDLDKYAKTETVYMVYELVNNNKIPEPTMVIDSGRGLHLYWRIENAPFQARYTWQEIEDYLYFKLKNLGADLKATDGARILRIPNTINSKNNEECKILIMNEHLSYSMYELREKYLGYVPRKEKRYQIEFEQTKIIDKHKVLNFYNSYTLHNARANDLQTLCRIRNYDMKGYRNMIIHCYTYWLGITVRVPEDVEKKVIELNNAFMEPLPENEIRCILRCVDKIVDKFIVYENLVRAKEIPKSKKGVKDKLGYWYKNSTLIERLDITPLEQQELKTIISPKEKYRRSSDEQKEKKKSSRRNENGLTKREMQRQSNIKDVRGLFLKGHKQVEIAEMLNLSKGYVSKILKEISNSKVSSNVLFINCVLGISFNVLCNYILDISDILEMLVC